MTKNTKKGNYKGPSDTRSEAALPEGTNISGRNAVRELLSSGRDIDKIFIQRGEREGSIKMLIAKARERNIPVIEVDRSKLDAISDGANHQGIVALAAEQNYSSVDEILEYARERGEAPFIVILDGVEDPHNLGAIIRSAECSGVHGVIIPKRRAVGLTSVVRKSSAGALEHMRVARVTNLAATLDELKERGLWIYGADMGGEAYSATDFSGNVAIVLGSEGFGISRLVSEKCDFITSIPLYGNVNSMNVSCAAAVILTEVARQRHK
jgi:23S rRNA (guanosine2251-2'-O)-methyltransferase